jgi:hypothetical protein
MVKDKAVLESHHIASTFALIESKEGTIPEGNMNIFKNLSDDDYKKIRERMITLVIGTDMSMHFQDLGKFKSRVTAGIICYYIEDTFDASAADKALSM